MIISIQVDINLLSNLKTDYPWPKPDHCPNCNNPKLWGHGFVDALLDGEKSAVPLKRYRCPNCGCVIKLKPKGYFNRFRATIDTIRKSITFLATTGKYVSGIAYQRQYHWFTALIRHATARYTANWHNFTFLIPHPNPPPLGEGVYEKRRLCQFAVYTLSPNLIQVFEKLIAGAVKSRSAEQFNLKTKSFFYDPTEGWFSRLKFRPVLQGGRLEGHGSKQQIPFLRW